MPPFASDFQAAVNLRSCGQTSVTGVFYFLHVCAPFAPDSWSRSFLCCSESQFKVCAVTFGMISCSRRGNNVTNNYSVKNAAVIFIVTEIFIITLCGDSVAVQFEGNCVCCVCVSRVPVTCVPPQPLLPPPPSFTAFLINNPDHHCHADATEEGEMQKAPKRAKNNPPVCDCFMEKGHCVSMGSATVPGSLSRCLHIAGHPPPPKRNTFNDPDAVQSD